MATKYVRAAGGLWNDNATWSLSSGGPADTTIPTSADDVITDSNSGASTNTASITVKSFTQTGTPGIVTNNHTVVSNGNVTLVSGKFVSADGSYLSIGGTCALVTSGNELSVIDIYVTGALTLGDNIAFIASKKCFIQCRGGAFNLNGKTISGNSATNRLLIYSNVVGTPRTITVNGGTFANCDFQDISFANGGADLDLSAITGGSGNCGGNSMSGGGTLTFTTPRTCTFKTTSGNWSDPTSWTTTGATDRVPLAQDFARFQPMASAGQTITVDMPRLPDTDFSGCGASNLPTVNARTTGTTYIVYGSLNLTGAVWSCNQLFNFQSRSNASLTSSGNTISSATVIILMPLATLTCNDAIISGSTVSLQSGTLYSAYNFTCARFLSTAGATLTRIGNVIWTMTGDGTVWSGLCTITAGTAIIALTYTGASATAFNGGTNIYNDIQIAPGSGVLTFSGAFTFRNMTMSSAGTRSIVFTKGTTYTQTGDTFLSGTAGNLITIASSGAGEPFTLSKASGLIASNYLAIKDSIATGGAVWLAGYNSTDNGGNTGWSFNSPASGAGEIEFASSATANVLANANPQPAAISFTASALTSAIAHALPEPVEVTVTADALAYVITNASGSAAIEFVANAIANTIANANPQPIAITIDAEAIAYALAIAIPEAIEIDFYASAYALAHNWNVDEFFKAKSRNSGEFFPARPRRVN